MSTKTPEQRAEERIPWDQATIDAVGLPYDGVHNTRDIARAAYATAIREEVEPRDRLLQEMVDALSRSIKCPEGCFGGAIPTMPDGEPEQCRWCFEHSDGISAITKAKEQFGITPTP